MDGLDPSGYGLGRGDLVKGDDPLKSELAALGGVFGLPAAELYRGGDDPARLDVLPHYKGHLSWVGGGQVQPPLSPDRRYTFGYLAAGVRMGVAPFVRRGAEGAA
ncbi:MAG TPA: hypothetical protein DEF51_50420, partial [Myxococcales bacterium]|nr:hypothetical protein [Myxococcales bacterium]